MGKKVFAVFVSILLAVVISGREHPFAGLGIQGYRINSAWPASFRSVKGTATINVNNSGERRTVTNIIAEVYRNGKPFASGTCSDVTFVRGLSSYTLTGVVGLSPGVSVWSAIGAALSFHPSEYIVDVSADLRYEDGTSEHIVRKGIPVTRFIH